MLPLGIQTFSQTVNKSCGVSETNKSIATRRKYCPKCRRIYGATDQVCLQDHTLLQPEIEGSLGATYDSPIGTVLADRYEILSEIGRGGMSIVYRGRHLLMDRICAIKMLLAQLMYDQTSKKRFQLEAEAASCLKHPNIIAVYDYGIAPTGQPYLVMEYLVGESLADLIKRDKNIEQRRVVRVFIQACDALSHAHNKGVIHRDLKSSNIMLVEQEDKNDVVKVLDFGIAKLMPASGKLPQNLTQTGEVFGSPIYMSPEQCLGQALDQRSDIYSMGTMAYEALTGVPPLVGNTIVDTMQMHVGTKPTAMKSHNVDVLPALEALVFKALEKKPENRFQTMQEMYAALKEVKSQLIAPNQSGTPSTDEEKVFKENSGGHLLVGEAPHAVTTAKKESPANGDELRKSPSSSQPPIKIDRQSDERLLLIIVAVVIVFILALLVFVIFQRW
jgi:eukaryotic-like serine/threonine-protein kinase